MFPENIIFSKIVNCDTPDSVALYSSDKKAISFGGLSTLIKNNISSLKTHGCDGSDRIAITISDGIEMASVCLSVMCFSTCVPLNTNLTKPEYDELLTILGVGILITDKDEAHPIFKAAIQHSIPIIKLVIKDSLLADSYSFEKISEYNNQNPSNQSLRKDKDNALILLTSGSTSKPKIVPITHKNINASTNNLVKSLELTSQDTCLNMMPMFHVGALIDLLIAPLSVGGSVICASSISSETFFNSLNKFSPSWYQGVPTMIRNIIDCISDSPSQIDNHSLRFIRSVSSPLDQQLKQRCEQYFNIPVIEIYGMTETTGLITSNPLPPAVRKAESVGIGVGTDVMVIDGAGNPSKPGHKGEILVRGENVTDGYESLPDSKYTYFIDDWFRTGDQGYLDEDGYLYITGRIKEIINRGGEKISPKEIDAVILKHPKVHEAACFAISHNSLGEDIAVAIVINQNQSFNQKELTDYLKPRLAEFKIPRKVYFIDALPKGTTGKILRKSLTERFSDNNQDKNNRLANSVSSPMITRLIKLWEGILKVSPIQINDNFFDLGGDSLKAATFISEFEKQSGLHVEISVLLEAQTIYEFSNYIENKTDNSNYHSLANHNPVQGLPDKMMHQLRSLLSTWRGQRLTPDSLIVGRNLLGTKTPIFWCVNADHEFSTFSKQIGADQPVYGLRSLYKVKKRSHKYTLALSKYYPEEILKIQPKGPFILGGFCVGGTIAFEIAQYLIEQKHEVRLLCLQEKFIPREYGGNVSLFFANPNRHNEFSKYKKPEIAWTKFYTGNVSVNQIDCKHEDLYDEINSKLFIKQLKSELENPEKNNLKTNIEQPYILTENSYKAAIKAPKLLVMTSGLKKTIDIKLINKSKETWRKTTSSGITIGNSWSSINGKTKIYSDGYVPLTSDILPGEEINTNITVTPPSKQGLWLLNIDLIDEGVCWFQEKGSKRNITMVITLN